MKNKYWYIILAFVVILFIPIYYSHASIQSFVSNVSQLGALSLFKSSTGLYEMRSLKLDTLEKSLLTYDQDEVGELTESFFLSSKKWKVKYTQKGSSRMICEPPVLNISFDKPKKDKPIDYFSGVSTYGTHTELQYQKIRLIPECDIWNEYWRYTGDIGFGGQLNVNLREFIIFKIFRAFGIPTADIVGFTEIEFKTPDPRYSGKKFRYMIVQRPAEQDDEIPFTQQFNLDSKLIESGDYESDRKFEMDFAANRLVSNTLTYNKDGAIVPISFDPDTTIRFLLLSDFLNLYDMAPLHNEDWGIDVQTMKTKIIPHGFDSSFACNFSESSDYLYVSNLISQIPISERALYQQKLYSIAQEIFVDNPQNIRRMVGLVEQFPYEEVDKEKLIEFLKIRFHQYASYFNSPRFAESLNQSFAPKDITLPFADDQEYANHMQSFRDSCIGDRVELKGVTVTLVDKPIIVKDKSVLFNLEITTSDTPLQMKKEQFGSSFNALVTNEDIHKIDEYNYSIQQKVVSGPTEDYPGPYFYVPPNSKIRLEITVLINKDIYLKGRYSINLEFFRPNIKVKEIPLNFRSDIFETGSISSVVIEKPLLNEGLEIGTPYTITWQGDYPSGFRIMVKSTDGRFLYYISNPDQPVISNSYTWDVGKVYVYIYDEETHNSYWKLNDYDNLQSGRYRIYLSYADLNLEIVSEEFNISKNIGGVEVFSKLKPKLSLKYDSNKLEERLEGLNWIVIKTSDKELLLPKEDAFSVNLISIDGNGFSGKNSQTYEKPDGVEDYDVDFYRVPPQKEVTFKVYTTFNPQQMLAGMYVSHAGGVAIQNAFLPVNGEDSGPVTVIGERMPNISSVTSSLTNGGLQLRIKGIRFAKEIFNTIEVYGISLVEKLVLIESKSMKSPNGTDLSYMSSINKPGVYYMVIKNTTGGRGDTFVFDISPSTIPRIEELIYDFGGMYGYYSEDGILKKYLNPATNSASCPLGYTSKKFSGATAIDHDAFYCIKNHVEGVDSFYDFGGMYGVYLDVNTGKIQSYTNPLTKGASCPQDFISSRIFGTANADFAVNFCYRKGTNSPLAEFGGGYGYSDVTTYNNYTTNKDSCPSKFSTIQIKGSVGYDYRSVYCMRSASFPIKLLSDFNMGPAVVPYIPIPTASPSISTTPIPSISASPTPRPSVSMSPTPSTTVTPTPTPSASVSTSPTPSTNPSPSVSISPVPTPSSSVTPSPSISASPTPSAYNMTKSIMASFPSILLKYIGF